MDCVYRHCNQGENRSSLGAHAGQAPISTPSAITPEREEFTQDVRARGADAVDMVESENPSANLQAPVSAIVQVRPLSELVAGVAR
jgi:hypothetical protein